MHEVRVDGRMNGVNQFKDAQLSVSFALRSTQIAEKRDNNDKNNLRFNFSLHPQPKIVVVIFLQRLQILFHNLHGHFSLFASLSSGF